MAHQEWCLRPGELLNTNEYLRSKNGLFYAVMQSDGNFVIYRGDWWEAQENTSMWNLLGYDPKPKRKLDDRNIKLPGTFNAIMRTDSNFMVYPSPVNHDDDYIWGMGGHYEAGIRYWALMQDDGNFCLKPNGDINASPSQIWIFCTNVTDSLDEKNIQFAEMVYDFKNAIIKARGGPKLAVSITAVNGTDINQSDTINPILYQDNGKGLEDVNHSQDRSKSDYESWRSNRSRGDGGTVCGSCARVGMECDNDRFGGNDV